MSTKVLSLQRPKRDIVRAILASSFLLFPFYFCLDAAHTQTPPANRGVIRLKVKFKSGDVTKELPRKRFFLIKGGLTDNKTLIEKIKQIEVMSRECYYRSQGASEALIKWLRENDCDSIYCREIEDRYLSGPDAVPEFQAAYNQGLREFKAPALARRWLTVNLGAKISDGFYKQKQEVIDALIKRSENATTTMVMSVMTDRKARPISPTSNPVPIRSRISSAAKPERPASCGPARRKLRQLIWRSRCDGHLRCQTRTIPRLSARSSNVLCRFVRNLGSDNN